MSEAGDLREEVRVHYAAAATEAAAGECCIKDEEVDLYGATLYGDDAAALPSAAVDASLGCGNPAAVADLEPGQVVLDLGSGAGIDVFLSARRVGPTGKVYGLDMTEEMLELARKNLEETELGNVEFLEGYIEAIPLPSASVDVVISNCVINLSVDKPKVFSEMYRVLRPGGRVGVTDVVFDDGLTVEKRSELGSYTGCIAGALSFEEYASGLTNAGFTDVSITPTHGVADRAHSAIIKATKPRA